MQKEVLFSRQAADTRELVFRHALMQEAAYDMLTAEDRVLGHRLAAEYLEATGAREAIVLAQHFERGATPLRAAHWYCKAAEESLAMNDLNEALTRVRWCIRLDGPDEVKAAAWLVEARAYSWRGNHRASKTDFRGGLPRVSFCRADAIVPTRPRFEV